MEHILGTVTSQREENIDLSRLMKHIPTTLLVLTVDMRCATKTIKLYRDSKLLQTMPTLKNFLCSAWKNKLTIQTFLFRGYEIYRSTI